jgi:hypothetical protein
MLEKYGYRVFSQASERHHSLLRAVRSKGYRELIRHLSEIATLQKNSNPEASRIIHDDMDYLRNHRAEYDKSRQALMMAKRLSRRHSRVSRH